jgi:hypothetical protein
LLTASCGSRSTVAPGSAATPATATTTSPGMTTHVTAATPTTGTRHQLQPTASATPSVQFVIGFNMGTGGWTLLEAGSAKSDSDLEGIANLLTLAVPLTPQPAGAPPLTCGPSGVMMLPAERLTPRWTIGLSQGATIQVIADIAPCGATSTSYATDQYASLNGHPSKAVGLVPRLLSLSQTLPAAKPLTITPATPSPGGTLQLTGDGWIGGDVAVTVFWCHQLGASDCTDKHLATLSPDTQGRIAWQGQMPADMPEPGTGYDVSIEAKNDLLDFVLDDIIR